MALTLLAERREPSGVWPVNNAKPAGWRPSATETQSKVSAIGLKASGNLLVVLSTQFDVRLSAFRHFVHDEQVVRVIDQAGAGNVNDSVARSQHASFDRPFGNFIE